MMDPQRYNPTRIRTPDDNTIQRYTVLGTILLCTLISGLLGDSLVGVVRIPEGEPVPRGWRWLLGTAEQTFGSQTFALLFGIVLLGFAFGGCWFLARMGISWLRSRLMR